MAKKSNDLSVVIPVYNESIGLEKFHESLCGIIDKMPYNISFIYIDDGSTDNSAEILRKLTKLDYRVKPIYLSRNFGKEIATTAGIHGSTGDAALILDADGQHPVELIPNFISAWEDGSKVVVGIRQANQKEGVIKRYGSKLFYKLLKVLGAPDVVPGSTDFRIIDKEVVAAFNRLTEHNRITRTLIDWLGFEHTNIYFTAKPREHGEASYSTKKLIKLALNGFVSLTFTPLYFSGYLGVVIMFIGLVMSTFAVINGYLLGDPLSLNISGTAILAMLILFLVGLLMVGQGLLALYIARIYTETENRPLYILKNNTKSSHQKSNKINKNRQLS